MYSASILKDLLKFIPVDDPLHHKIEQDLLIAEKIEEYINKAYEEHKIKHGKMKFDSCGTSPFTTRAVHSGLGSTYIVEGLGKKTAFYIDDFTSNVPFVAVEEKDAQS